MKKSFAGILFHLFVLNLTIAQLNRASLENTQSFEFFSAEVKDSFNISVAFPYDYHQSNKDYTTLYVLDANVTFGMVRDIQLLMSFEPENKPLLIVGIGYKDFNNWLSNRSRDYVNKVSDLDQGSKFLSFLKNELIPHIDMEYRTSAKKIIYGHSTAGLFGLSVLLNTTLFDGYIITSPSIDEDKNYIIDLEESNKTRKLVGKIFISYGSKEDELFKQKCFQFIEKLKSRNHQKLYIMSTESKGSHMTSMAPSFVEGLQFVTKE
ncbi:alpha/beta hydrolase [Ekhidna sp.]